MKKPEHKKQIIKVTKADFRKAGRYTDNCGCLFATAMKRHGFIVNSVMPQRVYTSIGTFNYPWTKGEQLIQLSYPRNSGARSKSQMSFRSKPRPNTRPFSVVITPVKP